MRRFFGQRLGRMFRKRRVEIEETLHGTVGHQPSWQLGACRGMLAVVAAPQTALPHEWVSPEPRNCT